MLFLAVAATMFCLVLLSASSSRAQTGGPDPAQDECDIVETEGSDTQQSALDENADASDQQTQNQNENDLQQTADEGDRQTQSQNDGDQQAQDQNEIDRLLAQDETQNGEVRQSQQGEDAENDGRPALQDGESLSPSSDAEGSGNDECADVIADTVPDELLPPTGDPVKSQSQAGATAAEKEKKSDRDEKKPDSGKKKKRSVGGERKPGSAEKKSGHEKKSNRGEKLEINNRSSKETGREKTEARSKSATAQKQVSGRSVSSRKKVVSDNKSRSSAPDSRREKPETFSRSVSAPDLAPVLASDWARPSREEMATVSKPRRFAPDPNAERTLSARALGVYDVPVASSDRLEELDRGLVRMPKSSLPWDRGDQRNVYIAGHYLGYPGTASRLVFYNLGKLKKGDELVLKDGQGRPYKYQVSEKLEVEPQDSWVMGQVEDRDMVTLQTCIPPDFGKRLVVRADRV